MKIRTLAAATLVLMTTSFAFAQAAAFNADTIAAQYKADGYTRIEIDVGLKTAKMEAFKDTSKLEVTYDVATGAVLKQETTTLVNATNLTPGVFVHNEGDDRGSRNGDDDGHGNDDHGGRDNDNGGHDDGDDD